MPTRHERRIAGRKGCGQEQVVSRSAVERAHEALMAGKEGVMDVVMKMGLAGIASVLEHARSQVCGALYERDGQSHLARWGYKRGRVYVGGQQATMDRPRVRDTKEGREVGLPAWDRLQDPGEFDETVFQRVVRGVSTRDYEGALGTTMEALGVKKSGVDRAFIRRATLKWQEMQERDLSGIEAWAVLIDGIYIRQEAVGICALAYTRQGEKEPLGFWEGTTESAENVAALFADLERRGFRLSEEQLFVVDGGGGLTKALENRFGKEQALICRCFLHKLRNLKKYLPRRHHGEATRRLFGIRDAATLPEAERELEGMLRWLKDVNVSAHRSLEEAGRHLTTLQRIGVPEELHLHLYSTNAIESMFSTGPRKVMRNVKRWRGSPQRQRYLASGMWWAWRRFRKLNGFRKIEPWLAQRGLATKRKAG